MTARYYVQRPATGLWLDTNAQLGNSPLTWSLSGPNSAKAKIPIGINLNPIAEDGRPVWGKWDSILLVEEDGDLVWGGVCTEAMPDADGLQLEFVGGVGWLQRVDFNAHLSVWKTNVFDIVRTLVQHAMSKPNSMQFVLSPGQSAFTVGDKEPDEGKPQPPARGKGQSEEEYAQSDEYKRYQGYQQQWDRLYGDREKFELSWFEAPYVGEEIDTLAKETGFEYRERVTWRDRGALTYQFHLDFADDMSRRRDDIAFVDGMNLAKALDPKNGAVNFANRVIGLGAGDGRDMVRAEVGADDGRLYQAEFVQYKSIANVQRLRSLAEVDLRSLSNQTPKIDSITVWDVAGFSPIRSLIVGDEVMVKSSHSSPPIEAWVKITKITRDPASNVAVLLVESV